MWATNLKVAFVVLATLGLYTLVANAIPQVQSEVPRAVTLGPDVTPEQLVQVGEQIYNGAGGCTACHGLGERAPNLLTDDRGSGLIGARCAQRQRGKECKVYLHEALIEPGEFVVPGFQPIMPNVSRTLPPQQIWALVAFLQSQGGEVTVTAEDLPQEGHGPEEEDAGGGGEGAAALAGGSTEPVELFRAAGCSNCHQLDGEGATLGPDLSKIGARQNAEQIRRGILEPDAEVAAGFEHLKGIMPKTFGSQFNAAQLESLVRFLAGKR
jgi:mono/diheme cytochrome c family protein